MDETAWIVALAFVLVFSLVSRRLDAVGLSPPLVFVAGGALLGEHGLGVFMLSEGLVDPLAEVTLVLVLYGDASRIDLRALREQAALPSRLLAVGMPLTIAAGTGLALWCFPVLSVWEAGLLAAVLAPTDAALGQAVVSSKEVPGAIRQALNVESGLNDGIALPVVMVFAAVAVAGTENTDSTHWIGFWFAQVGLGPLAGIAVALLGATAIRIVTRRQWMGETFERIAGLSLGLLAFMTAEVIGGNGFIAAFVAGLVIGNRARDFAGAVHEFVEAEGQLLMIAVFLLVGSLWAYPAIREADSAAWGYAVGSLTVVRMVPVAMSLIGRRLRWPTVAFLGWFGPRGLATVLFALLVVEHEVDHGELLFSVAMLTVVLSVVVHGLSARPGSAAYGRWATRLAERPAADEEHAELAEVMHHPMRVDHGRASRRMS